MAELNARSLFESVTRLFMSHPVVMAALVLGQFRLRQFVDDSGVRALLIQRRIEGKRHVTVMAIDSDGNVWAAGTLNASTDFDVKKWNPS